MISIVRKDDVVIVWKLDRLGRSLRHLMDLVSLFREKGVEFVSINDNIDTTTIHGRLFIVYLIVSIIIIKKLLNSRSIFTIEPIFGELLLGALNKREEKYIIKFWNYISKINQDELFIKAGKLSFKEKLVSKGIKLIDATIIYTTVNNNFKLWTLDKKIIQHLDEKYLYSLN